MTGNMTSHFRAGPHDGHLETEHNDRNFMYCIPSMSAYGTST